MHGVYYTLYTGEYHNGRFIQLHKGFTFIQPNKAAGLTADSDHLVKAGESTYEISKQGGKTTAKVVSQKKFRDALVMKTNCTQY